MKVLSLSEATGQQAPGYVPTPAEYEELKRAWADERESLVSAVQALKELLSETQRTSDTSKVGWVLGRDESWWFVRH